MNEGKRPLLTCPVVRDLLPLYHDGVVSGETRSAVGEHLMGCQDCRREYEALREALPEAAGREKTTLGRFRELLRRQKRKKILAIVLAAVLAVAVTAGGIVALSQWCIVPVRADAFAVRDVCLVDTPAGELVFVRWSSTYGGSSTTRSRISDDGHAVDIEMKHHLLEWAGIDGLERDDFWFVPVEEIDAVTFNGQTVWEAEDEVREDTGYARAVWEWEQALHTVNNGAASYDFTDEYVYLLFPDGHEEYWSYDGERLDGPAAME